MHATLVLVDVKPADIAGFIEITKYNAENSRRETGNVRFDVIQTKADPTKFYLYEVYETADFAAAHKTTEHYLKWRETVAPMMASPRVPIPLDAVLI